jgi:hypothetical protein
MMSDYKCGKCSQRMAIHSYAYCYHDSSPLTIHHRCAGCWPPLGLDEGYNPGPTREDRGYLVQSNWIEEVDFRETGQVRGGRLVVRDVARHSSIMCDRCRLDVFWNSVTWEGNDVYCPRCDNAQTLQCDYCSDEVYAVFGPEGARYCSGCDWKHRNGSEVCQDNKTMRRA